jgi:hypothetical protein
VHRLETIGVKALVGLVQYPIRDLQIPATSW